MGLQGRCPTGNTGHLLPPAGSFLSVAKGRRGGKRVLQTSRKTEDTNLATLFPPQGTAGAADGISKERAQAQTAGGAGEYFELILGSQHKPFPEHCSPDYLAFPEGAPQLHLSSSRASGPTPYDATSTRGSWSIPDVPSVPCRRANLSPPFSPLGTHLCPPLQCPDRASRLLR